MKTETVTITPAYAAALLKLNVSNRSISTPLVDALARDMVAGRFKLTHQGILLSSEGYLLDGQHRLSACVRSGVAIRQLVTTLEGDEDENLPVDQGRIRRFADIVRMKGNKDSFKLAACARFLIALNTGRPAPRMTYGEGEEVLLRYGLGNPTSPLGWMQDAPKARGTSGAYYLAPMVWVYRLYPEQVASFHEGVQTGVGLLAGSPELVLRDSFGRYPTGGSHGYLAVLRVLNAFDRYVEGGELKKLFSSTKGYRRFAKELGLDLDDTPLAQRKVR